MAAGVKGDNEPYDDINITPMLDLAYVLLIIFIIMTTASIQGIQVDLPKASNTPSLAEPKTKAITITAEGDNIGGVDFVLEPRTKPGAGCENPVDPFDRCSIATDACWSALGTRAPELLRQPNGSPCRQ